MSSLASGNHVDDSVTVLWDIAGVTYVGYGKVAAEVPFAVDLSGSEIPDSGMDVRLVRDQGDKFVAGRAKVGDIEDGIVILRNAEWEEPNRRVHTRHDVHWPATIRTLDDHGSHVTMLLGETTDISEGGAAIHVENAPEVGTLVELMAVPPDSTPLRAVAVVVRRTGDDIGLAFLFLWASARMGIQRLAA